MKKIDKNKFQRNISLILDKFGSLMDNRETKIEVMKLKGIFNGYNTKEMLEKISKIITIQDPENNKSNNDMLGYLGVCFISIAHGIALEKGYHYGIVEFTNKVCKLDKNGIGEALGKWKDANIAKLKLEELRPIPPKPIPKEEAKAVIPKKEKIILPRVIKEPKVIIPAKTVRTVKMNRIAVRWSPEETLMVAQRVAENAIKSGFPETVMNFNKKSSSTYFDRTVSQAASEVLPPERQKKSFLTINSERDLLIDKIQYCVQNRIKNPSVDLSTDVKRIESKTVPSQKMDQDDDASFFTVAELIADPEVIRMFKHPRYGKILRAMI